MIAAENRGAQLGSACTLTEYAKPRKPKRRKFKVGFAIPKKPKAEKAQR